VRFVDRSARRLARATFHAMLRYGPKLEKRQMVLFRLVDVGAELFAMSAACARAEMLRRKGQAEAVELADIFCRYARGRVKHAFSRVFWNNDVRTYRLAQHVLEGKHAWLEG
jgi:ACAD9/ACADV, C-terminal domain/Acyl-CoA dehydrogenase, C-terminal, bacterial type